MGYDDRTTRRGEGRLGRPPLPPGVKNERFSCYVPEAVREGLDDLATEQRITRTNLVRAILTDYVAARRALPPSMGMAGAVGAPGAITPGDRPDIGDLAPGGGRP